MRLRALPVVLAASLFGIVPSVRAQDNSAAVETLFNEGKKLEAEGKVAEACPKFLASFNLERRVGTLLNLADCYERNGQFASAWARFVEAKTLAYRAGQEARGEFAAQHAAALEPKLSKLTITVAAPAAGLVVKRDGVVVEPGAYGVAMAADAGKHVVEVSAPKKKPWTGDVTLGAAAEQKTVAVPALLDAPQPLVMEPPEEKKRGKSPRAITGLALAGVGVVGLGIGTVFGISALGKNSDSKQFCGADGNKNDCTSQGLALRSDAVSNGNLSTIFLGVGAVVAVGGTVLWLTAPSSHSQANVAFDGRTLRLGGSF